MLIRLTILRTIQQLYISSGITVTVYILWTSQGKCIIAAHKNPNIKITAQQFFSQALTASGDLPPSLKACGSSCYEVWVWASTLVWSGVSTTTCGGVCWHLVESDGLCCVWFCQLVSVCVCVSSVPPGVCLVGVDARLHLLHRSLMSRSPCTAHLTNSAELVCGISRKLDTEKIMWSDWGL